MKRLITRWRGLSEPRRAAFIGGLVGIVLGFELPYLLMKLYGEPLHSYFWIPLALLGAAYTVAAFTFSEFFYYDETRLMAKHGRRRPTRLIRYTAVFAGGVLMDMFMVLLLSGSGEPMTGAQAAAMLPLGSLAGVFAGRFIVADYLQRFCDRLDGAVRKIRIRRSVTK
jgi:hypothetical protein